MCINWKIVAGLGVVALAILVFAPQFIGAAAPLLVLALCPISMGVMMWAMAKNGGAKSCKTDSNDAISTELAESRTEIEALRAEVDRLHKDRPIS